MVKGYIKYKKKHHKTKQTHQKYVTTFSSFKFQENPKSAE